MVRGIKKHLFECGSSSVAGLLVRTSAAALLHAPLHCSPAERAAAATLPFRHGAEGCDSPVRYSLLEWLRLASAFTSSNLFKEKKKN